MNCSVRAYNGVRMKRLLTIAGAVLLAILAAGGIYVLTTDQAAAPTSSPSLAQTDAPDMGDAPHPLSRDAIAAKEFPASPITVEQDLGVSGGIHSYVVSYRSDGYKIRALLSVPPGQQPAAGWPVIIFNHGYIPPKEYRTTGGDYQYWIDGLTRAGYIVIKPDYRGHDQSEGPAVGGNYAPDYVYDVLTLEQSLGNWPGADPNRVGMVGHSMGGAITLRAVTAKPESAKASAILAGVVGTAEDMYYHWRRTPPRPTPSPGMFGTARRDMAEKYGDPRQNPDFWNSVTPINFVQFIAGPVQIHHAADDGEVPKEFSDHLNTALTNAGKSVQYYQYPGGGHQFTGTGGLVLQRMIELFNGSVK